MKSILGAIALAIAAFAISSSSIAQNADDPMADLYGNTQMCQAPGIFECYSWFKPDGTFITASYDKLRAGAGDGDGLVIAQGTWKMNKKPDGTYEMCRAQAGQPERCGPFTSHKVGERWNLPHTEGRFAGMTEKFYLLKGVNNLPWPTPPRPGYKGDDPKDPMRGFYTNTEVCGIEGYTLCHVWYNPDGTLIHIHVNFVNGSIPVDAKKPDGPKVDGTFIMTLNIGTWRTQMKDGKLQLCRFLQMGQPERCGGEVVERKVGDKWELNFDKRGPEKFTLIAGR